MNDLTESYALSTLLLLVDWSLRWGVLIVVLYAGLALWPPRRVATRLSLCRLVLAGGLVLPLLPHTWGPTLSPAPSSSPARPLLEPEFVSAPTYSRQEAPGAETAPQLVPVSSSSSSVSTTNLVRELQESSSARGTASLDTGERVVRALLALWLAGVLLLLGRLALGCLWLARLRRSARPAAAQALELLHRCRTEMSLRRELALLTHPDIQAPILIGGWQPAIVVPVGWEGLPAETRRAALFHELAHLAHHDDWAKLGEETARAFFFFHPLVHWLLNRIDGERERLCDADVVRQGIQPRHLARVLLDFVNSLAPGKPAVAPGAALPFLKRITIKDRIHQLLEPDMIRWITPLSRGRRAALAAAVLGVMAALGSFGVRAGASDENNASETPQGTAKATAVVSGFVKDSEDRPIPGATVLLANFCTQDRPLMVQTGPDGSFVFRKLPVTIDNLFALKLVAGKAGYAPALGWATADDDDARNLKKVLKLDKAATISGSVRDGQGRAVAGARVEFGAVERYGNGASWAFAPIEAVRGTILEPFWFTQTDNHGRFQFATVPAGKELVFRVWADDFADLDTSPGYPTAQYKAGPGALPVQLMLPRGGRVDGRVVARMPDVKVGGLHIWLEAAAVPGYHKQAWTNSEGLFHFGGVPEGSYIVHMDDSPADALWTAKNAPAISVQTGATTDVQVELIEGVVVEGRVISSETGKPIPKAAVGGHGPARPERGHAIFRVKTDAEGRYRLRMPPGATEFFVQTPPPGYISSEHQSVVIPEDVKTLIGPTLAVRRRTALEGRVVDARGTPVPRAEKVAKGDAKGPDHVLPDELAGTVVDDHGQPLEGVHVHVWDWVDRPENQAITGKNGVFHIKDCGRGKKVEVRFRKPGYSPVLFAQQPVGVPGLVVALDQKTYVEGVVHGPDGKPAANALIRANQGPKMGDGVVITTVWTETKTDASGRYRLYVEPDAYEFLVKLPGVGVARLPKLPIAHGEAKALDIQLQPGITFRALTIDAQTGQPVPRVRLWNWEHKDVEGHSDAKGQVSITEMLPGAFHFSVEAPDHARWWSEDALSEWNRAPSNLHPGSETFQRNFDGLDFTVKPEMPPVRIVLEKGVHVTGRVLDPNDRPVGGATVAPALTGTGNSLTGDTRYSVATKPDGTFEMLLPASGKAEYNLVAHDGKYGEWRHWANGVLPPIRTIPGQVIQGLTLKLTKPATVRGKVLDALGKPVGYREVCAQSADKLENRYYDPTTTSKEDGSFELRFIRPGEHYFQVARFRIAPATDQKIELTEGQSIEGITIVGADRNR
jgi:beta-lactamase regulating signal transducer with metallopeptidase domain